MERWTRYVNAILAGSFRDASSVIDDACDDGADMSEIYHDIIQPAMREVGRLWQENEVTVADEHLATAVTQMVMANLFGKQINRTPRGSYSILAACVDTERHEVGLRMLCDLLEVGGWDATYLGSTVPIESLVAMVVERRPTVLALAATITPNLPRMRLTIQAVRENSGDRAPLIIVGGRPFLGNPDLAKLVGADLTAQDAREAVRLLQEWVAAQPEAGK